jgi:hypothetical protein
VVNEKAPFCDCSRSSLPILDDALLSRLFLTNTPSGLCMINFFCLHYYMSDRQENSDLGVV